MTEPFMPIVDVDPDKMLVEIETGEVMTLREALERRKVLEDSDRSQ